MWRHSGGGSLICHHSSASHPSEFTLSLNINFFCALHAQVITEKVLIAGAAAHIITSPVPNRSIAALDATSVTWSVRSLRTVSCNRSTSLTLQKLCSFPLWAVLISFLHCFNQRLNDPRFNSSTAATSSQLVGNYFSFSKQKCQIFSGSSL